MFWLNANHHYRTSNSRECTRVNGELLQVPTVYKNSYFILQVMRESISVLQGTVTYYITTAIVQSYTGKYHCYSCCALVTVHSTSNNANGNQQVTKCQRQQVTKFVSGITSHVSYAWMCNEIGSLCHHHYSDKLYWKKKNTSQQVEWQLIFFWYTGRFILQCTEGPVLIARI